MNSGCLSGETCLIYLVLESFLTDSVLIWMFFEELLYLSGFFCCYWISFRSLVFLDFLISFGWMSWFFWISFGWMSWLFFLVLEFDLVSFGTSYLTSAFDGFGSYTPLVLLVDFLTSGDFFSSFFSSFFSMSFFGWDLAGSTFLVEFYLLICFGAYLGGSSCKTCDLVDLFFAI